MGKLDPSRVDGCPSDFVLQQFALGKLAERSDTIEMHLRECTSCVARLDDLKTEDDPLVANLRKHVREDGGHGDPPNQPTTKSLYENAIRLGTLLPDLAMVAKDYPLWSPRQRLDFILIDQHFRWLAQQPIRVEGYLSHFSDLSDDAVLLAEVVIEEFGYREAAGESPNRDEYIDKFPHLYHVLLRELNDAQRTSTTESNMSTSWAPIQIGDVIGPYHVEEFLGRGGFSDVWLAERRGALATTKVALKVPRPSRQLVDQIRMEAQTWVRASGHANVVPIIEADIYDGRLAIASEYIAEGSLQDLLRQHPTQELPAPLAIDIVIGILLGLEHLHGRGIVHRDVKPANVMLQGNCARLTDFGLSRELQEFEVAGSLGGTIPYMAPESFEGYRTVATDLWSVGVVLYQLVLGIRPYESNTYAYPTYARRYPKDSMFDLERLIRGPAPVPIPESLDSELRTVLETALKKDPSRRFQSAAEMRAKLSAIRRGRELAPNDAEDSSMKYLTIAVTGSMTADAKRVRASLQSILAPFIKYRVQWYVGTLGTVDEVTVEILASQRQQMLLVGYGDGDVSLEMEKLIARHDLTFVDAQGLTVSTAGVDDTVAARLKELEQRDAYFVTKGDLIILIWDRKSPGTRELLEWLMANKKDHMLLFV